MCKSKEHLRSGFINSRLNHQFRIHQFRTESSIPDSSIPVRNINSGSSNPEPLPEPGLHSFPDPTRNPNQETISGLINPEPGLDSFPDPTRNSDQNQFHIQLPGTRIRLISGSNPELRSESIPDPTTRNPDQNQRRTKLARNQIVLNLS